MVDGVAAIESLLVRSGNNDSAFIFTDSAEPWLACMLWVLGWWNMTKKFIWTGFFLGSSIGGFVPAMWGGDMISIWGIVMSFVGGIAGMWAGYRVSQWV